MAVHRFFGQVAMDDVDGLTPALDAKAATSYVDSQVAGRATTGYVDSQVAGLASTGYVDSAVSSRVLSTDVRLSVKPYPPVTLTYAPTVTTNAALGTHFRLAMSGNVTLNPPINPTDGQVVVWALNATGAARTCTLSTISGGFLFGSDITAITATVSGKTDFLQCVYNATDNKWYVIGYVKGLS